MRNRKKRVIARGALLAIALATAGCPAPEPDDRQELPEFGVRPAPSPSPDATEPEARVKLAGPFLFYDDFEHGSARWQASQPADTVGWFLLHAPTCSGAYTMLYGLPERKTFVPGKAAETFLTLRGLIDLGKGKQPHLTYTVRGQIQPTSAFTLQPELAAEPGGVWRAFGTPALGRYATGFTRFADLTALAGQKARLRFRLTVAPGGRTDGFYLDDVQIIEPVGS